MASFSGFLQSAASLVLSLSSANGNSGAYFTLSCGGKSVTFPISPASFTVSDSYGNSSVTINSLGEMNMLGKRKLSSLSFSSFFPAQYYEFQQAFSLHDPYSYVDDIKAMAEMGQPSRISISGTTVSMPVSIDDFQYSEKDGTGDVYFSITLREYRDFTTSILPPDGVTGLKNRAAEVADTKSVLVRAGHTAMDIASICCSGRAKIAAQSAARLALYQGIVKAGGVTQGESITADKNKVTIRGNDIPLKKEGQ